MSGIVKHSEDSKPGAGIVVHGRRVTSARLAAVASAVMGDPQFADKPQEEAVTAVQERRDRGRISV